MTFFINSVNSYPQLDFWKKLPTKSTFTYDETTESIIFSHVASNSVYFLDNNSFNHQCIYYSIDHNSDDHTNIEITLFGEELSNYSSFPMKIEYSNNLPLSYVEIPVQYYTQIITDFKEGKVQLYDDYMDQGWGPINTLSYINGENIWILESDFTKKYTILDKK